MYLALSLSVGRERFQVKPENEYHHIWSVFKQPKKQGGSTVLKQLIEEMAEIDTKAAGVKKEKADCQARIDEFTNGPVKKMRLAQGKDLGAVSVLVDGFEVKHSITKKVEWDQEKLFDIFKQISASDEDVAGYLTLKFSVPEKLYSKFDPAVKAIFKKARTVSPGAAKTELKERVAA